MQKPTERFTQTVSDYLKYRPSYPPEVLQVLKKDCGLKKTDTIADVGSGTGFLAKPLLEEGNVVYGVEPNAAMRSAAAYYLQEFPNYHMIDATAEATTLADHSIDIITVGTAFHWFDIPNTKIEFQRILKPDGWVVLAWNVRDIGKSKLLREYEDLIIKYGTDYKDTNAIRFDKVEVEDFFKPNEMHVAVFPHKQVFDLEGLQGRLLSTSYCPRPGDKNFSVMMHELKNIFYRHQHNGFVEFLYETKLYYGQLT